MMLIHYSIRLFWFKPTYFLQNIAHWSFTINAFNANKSFGHKDGLAFAMGIIQWDDSDSPLEDPAYG